MKWMSSAATWLEKVKMLTKLVKNLAKSVSSLPLSASFPDDLLCRRHHVQVSHQGQVAPFVTELVDQPLKGMRNKFDHHLLTLKIITITYSHSSCSAWRNENYPESESIKITTTNSSQSMPKPRSSNPLAFCSFVCWTSTTCVIEALLDLADWYLHQECSSVLSWRWFLFLPEKSTDSIDFATISSY